MDALFASSPVVVALVCLLGLRLSSARTAGVGYALAVAMALAVPSFRPGSPGLALTMATAKGLLISSIVIYVLLFGLFLYNVLRESGALASISRAVAATATAPVHQALLICAALGPFLEATTGFGVGIVIVAPLLLALGFRPERAAILALLTQSAVPWGALAVGTVLNAELSGVPLRSIGVGSAALTVPLYLLYGVLIAGLAGGWRSLWRHAPAILLVWLALSIATWGVNAYVAVPLAGVIAGAVAAGALSLYLRGLGRAVERSARETAAGMDGDADVAGGAVAREGVDPAAARSPSLWRCVVPYGILVGFSLLVNLWPLVSRGLSQVLVIRVPSLQFELPLLTSPGFALLLASVAGIAVFHLGRTEVSRCVRQTLVQVWPVAVSTAGFVAMSTVMQRTGMMDVIAHTMADGLGQAFIVASPILGALGGFITGSNSAANALFAPFQSSIALSLHQPPALFASMQNVAASNLTMASPSRVALAASIVGLSGGDGALTRRMMGVAGGVIVLVLAGGAVWMWTTGR